MNQLKLSFAKGIYFLLMLCLLPYLSFGQDVELILQQGHESSPVQSAAISPDNAVLASIDQTGKVILWDIATGLQLDEVYTDLYSSSEIYFDDRNHRSLWVDNKKNQLIALDFGRQKAGKGFWGKSVECLRQQKNNNFSPVQQVQVDPCESVEMLGTWGTDRQHYAFVTAFNEVFICTVDKGSINRDFDSFYWPNFEPQISLDDSPDYPSVEPEFQHDKPKTKQSKIADSKVTKSKVVPRPQPNINQPNQAIKSFKGLEGETLPEISVGTIQLPSNLAYNETSEQLAFVNPREVVLTSLAGQSIRVLNKISYDRNSAIWLSPAADYVGIANRGEFSWIRLEDGSQTTMALDGNRLISQLKVFPEQNVVLIKRNNNQLELYDFAQKQLLFKKTFQEDWTGLTLSKDRTYLVTTHGNNGIHLWNVHHNALVRVFSAGIPRIFQMRLTESEGELLTLLENGAVFSLQMGRSFAFQNILPPEEGVYRVGFSPTKGTMLWTQKKDSRTLWINHKGKKESLKLGRNFQVDKFYFSPDGAQFAVTSKKGEIEVYQTDGANRLAEFPALGFEVNHLAFHPTKSVIAIAYRDRIKLADWQLEPPDDWGELNSDSESEISGIRFSVSKSGGRERPTNENGPLGPVNPGNLIYVEFSQTGQYLILRGAPQAGILRIGANNELERLYPDPKWRRIGHNENIFAMGLINKAFESSIYSPVFLNNDRYILFETKEESLEIWDFIEVSQFLKDHEGDRAAFPGQPLYTVNTSDILYESFQVMENHPIIIFNCDVDGIKLVNYQTNQLLANLFPVNEQKMLIVNSENYYYSTSRGYDMLAFRQGEKVFPLEQFDLQYNRPDKVLESIGLTSDSLIAAFYKAYQKRLGKLNFSEDMFGDEFTLPELDILTTNLPTLTTQSALEISVRATDPLEKLDRLNVYINNVPLYGKNGIDLRGENTNTFESKIDLALSEGQNKVQLSVLNQAGRESLKETFFISCQGSEAKPDLYFVGLGVAKYATESKNLKYPVKDVVDLATLLAKDSVNFGKVHIHQFTDQEVTLDKLAAIKAILLETDVNDRVVLFYAGHGLFDQDLNYYLAAHGVNFEKPEINGIPYEAFEDMLDGIPARFKLSLMDACHSGEIDKENMEEMETVLSGEENVLFRSSGVGLANKNVGMENSFELMKEIFVDLRRVTGTTVISSAGGVEFAVEGDKWNNSVFTYCLLRALEERNADLDRDGSIMVSELQQYLSYEVQRLTNGFQRPTMRLENIANDWNVW